jgi:hypothetical protein
MNAEAPYSLISKVLVFGDEARQMKTEVVVTCRLVEAITHLR